MSVTPPTQEVGKEGRIDSLEMTGESRKEEGLVTVTDFPSHPPPQRSQICSLVQALLPPSPSFHLLSTITGNSQALLKTPSLFQHRSGHTERVWVLQEAEGNSYKKKKKKKKKWLNYCSTGSQYDIVAVKAEIKKLKETKHTAYWGMFLETVSWEGLFLLLSSLGQFYNTDTHTQTQEVAGYSLRLEGPQLCKNSAC